MKEYLLHEVVLENLNVIRQFRYKIKKISDNNEAKYQLNFYVNINRFAFKKPKL
jgi:hypothetical protein